MECKILRMLCITILRDLSRMPAGFRAWNNRSLAHALVGLLFVSVIIGFTRTLCTSRHRALLFALPCVWTVCACMCVYVCACVWERVCMVVCVSVFLFVPLWQKDEGRKGERAPASAIEQRRQCVWCACVCSRQRNVCLRVYDYKRIFVCKHARTSSINFNFGLHHCMGWLRLVGSLKI